MKCGECGARITAERKIKKQKNRNIHHYILYHCTWRKRPKCSQRSIQEKDLEEQIIEALAEIQIPPEFREWAMEELRKLNEIESKERGAMYGNQRREYDNCVKKIDNLIDMRANGELSEEEFKNKKKSLLLEKERLQELLNDTDRRVDNWLELAERVLIYAEKAPLEFETAEPERKKEIFADLGSNLLLKDQKLIIEWDNSLLPMKKASKEQDRINQIFEPLKRPINKGEIEEMYASSPIMQGCWNDLGTFIRNCI